MKRTITKDHEATAKELLGYGPDVVMAGGAKKKIKAKAKQVERGQVGKVFLSTDRSADVR